MQNTVLNISDKIFHSRKVTDNKNHEYPLHSHTSKNQCLFLKDIISEIDARVCLEIGLAYGISSLHICEAIHNKPGGILHSIDPFQSNWSYIGIKNLEKVGALSFVKFYEDYSHNVLPILMKQGVKIDFAYLDTSKVFDVVFVDAYYLNMMLNIGGVMVFDDCTFPGLRKLSRYLTKMPNLKIYRTYSTFKCSKKLKYFNRIVRVFPMADRIFSKRITEPEDSLGINANCIAFQKISDDDRNWDWFQDF